MLHIIFSSYHFICVIIVIDFRHFECYVAILFDGREEIGDDDDGDDEEEEEVKEKEEEKEKN